MQVIVLSAGKSGTNLLLECMTGHDYFISTSPLEDKWLFWRDDKELMGKGGLQYPNRFLTKSDITYILAEEYFHNFMDNNKHATILWSVRHPYDWVLSKMYGGRIREGKKTPAFDATVDGCKHDMFSMYKWLSLAEKHYSLRVLRVRMEDIILNIELECKRICKFLCIRYQKEMSTPWVRMRAEGYKKLYGNKLDASRVNVYKDLDTAYGGYFADKIEMVEDLFEYVTPLVEEFSYVV
jgi:hypothetical protein